jgi:prepilin-type N-terminal cleavage/methylation domain-containing protein
MKNKISNQKSQIKNPKAFSLVELLIVIVIIGILSVVSFVAIEGVKKRAMNERMTDDLVAIANSLEDYKRDHQMSYPLPDPGSNQNVLCYYADATYAHGCATTDGAVFRQGMIDNTLLSKRYLRAVPTDPRTGSRYVYGVTNDGKYFQVAGIYERDDGTYEARTVENLAKGFPLPSIIRAYDGANFVTDKGTFLPYSPDYTELTGTLNNITGTVTVNGATPVSNGFVLHKGDTVKTSASGGADIYFSDGSTTTINPDTELRLDDMQVKKNDKDGTITKILMKLNAGKIWSKVVRLASNSEFKVETTGAIAGVRGTECGFEVDAAGKLKTVQCFSGSVEVTDVAGTTTIASLVVPPAVPATATSPATPAIPQQLVFTGGTPTPSPMPADQIAAVNTAYYKDIPLNTSMVPYIISANGGVSTGTITVRNVNFFSDAVNAQLGLTGEMARSVQANKLALYAVTPGTTNISSSPIKSIDISGTSDPYIVPISSFGTYVLRFEYWDTAGSIINSSAFSQPPVTIQSGTNITEENIHPNLFTGSRPELTLSTNSPYSSPGNSFTVTATITNPSQNETYTISAVPVTENTTTGAISYCSVSSSSPYTVTSTTPSIDIPVTASAIGTCTLNVTATSDLMGAQIPPKTISVGIIGETDKLALISPTHGQSIQAGNPVTLTWAKLNAPEGVKYELIVKKDSSSLTLNPAYNGNDTSYTLNGLIEGTYQWTVNMLDTSGKQIGTKSDTFTVVRQVNVDFTFSPPINCSSTQPTQCSVNVTTQPFITSVSTNGIPSTGYTYKWTFDPDLSLPSPHTLLSGTDSSFSATLHVPAAGASYQAKIDLVVSSSGSQVSDKFKIITVTNNQPLTADNFALQTIPAQRGTNLPIPQLLFIGLSGNTPISLEKCSELTPAERISGTAPNYIYTPPIGTATSDTITCTIPRGTNIQGHFSKDPLAITIGVTITDVTPKQITGIAFESTMPPVKSGETATMPKIKGTLYDGTFTTFTTFELSQCNDSIQSPSLGSINKVTGIYTAPANITGSSTTINIVCEMSAGSKVDTNEISYPVSATAPQPATIAVTITNSCGDGNVETVKGEQCDDNNVAPGDGCNNTCTIEDGWDCSGTKTIGTNTGVSDCKLTLASKCVGLPGDPHRQDALDPVTFVKIGLKNTGVGSKNTFYSNSGECWALGGVGSSASLSCSTVCPAVNSNLSCDSSGWNDYYKNTTTSVITTPACTQLTGNTANGSNSDLSSPFYSVNSTNNTFNKCSYRNTLLLNTSCDATKLTSTTPPIISYPRICRCK